MSYCVLYLFAISFSAILTFTEAKLCTNITVPVAISARQGLFGVPTLSDSTLVTTFAQNYTRQRTREPASTTWKLESQRSRSSCHCFPFQPNIRQRNPTREVYQRIRPHRPHGRRQHVGSDQHEPPLRLFNLARHRLKLIHLPLPTIHRPRSRPVHGKHQATITAGEVLTMGAQSMSAAGFKGPVLVLAGEEDEIFYGGNCTESGGFSILELARGAFPDARAFEGFVQPNMGHAVNMHYNSSGAYRVMNEFLGLE